MKKSRIHRDPDPKHCFLLKKNNIFTELKINFAGANYPSYYECTESGDRIDYRARDTMTHLTLQGNKLRVEFSAPKPVKIFVGGLSPETSSIELRSVCLIFLIFFSL